MKNKHQFHIVANAAVSSGGEGLAALRYAESIASAGCEVTFLSRQLSAEPEHSTASLENGSFDRQVVPARHNLLIELFDQYRFLQKLCEQKKCALIHLHGMWSPLLAVAALVAYKQSIPLIISPHGCLEPWALNYKYHKKWLALLVYQKAVLCSASLFIATANQELESIRQLGLRQPIAVIPNGVDIGAPPNRDRHDSYTEINIILFLSRINPKKGLLDLVEAWAKIRCPGWRIVIAGGDEDGYRAKVEALIQAKKLQADFEFIGFVEGDHKKACFESADIFVLPTYSENFGIAVAEALVNELPVITTTGAPWQDLIEHRCGWWVDPGVQGIADALIDAMKCHPEELRKMGARGRQLVIKKYSWNMVGTTALEVSEWLLDASLPVPDIVNQCGQ